MEKIIFSGAVFSMIIVAITSIVSLLLFIWKWFSEDIRRDYKDAMESK